MVSWADPGGGGSRPALLCHDVGILTLGPKLDPRLPPLLLVDLIWTPPLSKILDPPLGFLYGTCSIRTDYVMYIVLG